jgi:hypothetical protein
MEQITVNQQDNNKWNEYKRYEKECQRLVAEKLNKLENVKVEMETGAVFMWKSDRWYFLNAVSYCFSYKDKHFIADYENLRIGFFCPITGKMCYICSYGDYEYRITISDNLVTRVNLTHCIGVLNEETCKIEYFPPITYRVYIRKTICYYDENFNMFTSGRLNVIVPHKIQSYQGQVHVIGKSQILITDKLVEKNGNFIQIEKVDYVYVRIRGDGYYLINKHNKIPLMESRKFIVDGVKCGDLTTFDGLIIPNRGEHWTIYNINNIWFKDTPSSELSLINPLKPTSGQKTKAAVSTDTFE